MWIETLIGQALALGASDLHLAFGVPPKARLDGKLIDLQEYSPLTQKDCEIVAEELLGRPMPPVGEVDMSMQLAGRRVRINLFRQRGQVSAVLRLLADQIPELDDLRLPPAVQNLPRLKRGIVLVTGETGSGKSTTLAALLRRINETRQEHIITLEDPIEYIHKSEQSLVNQREIGRDTASYADGLRAVLRADPNVILIGEMRDLAAIETALTAAETGHLVFSTLHTSSAADSIDRVVGGFSTEQQRQIRMQLAMTLQAVLSQQLLPCQGGGRVAACELMMVSPAVRSLIREGQTPQIADAVAASADLGSITMDNALICLFKDKQITAETARQAAHDADYVKKNTRL